MTELSNERETVDGLLHRSPNRDLKSEHALLDQAVAGNRAALDQLIRQYEKNVYRLAYRFFRDHEEAQDAAQEIFMKMVHALPKFERRSSFKTWLYRITANTCLSMVEAKKRRQTSVLDLVLGWFSSSPAEDPGETVVARLQQQELRNILEEKIAALPEIYRLPVILRDMEGMSHEQIKEILDIKEGTVKSRINRGRRMLQESLQLFLARERKL